MVQRNPIGGVKVSVALFPWKEFALWVRSGVIAGSITNKLMDASSPSTPGVNTDNSKWQTEELELLQSLAAESSGDRLRLLSDQIQAGQPTETTQEFVRDLWMALMSYGTTSPEFGPAKTRLQDYLSQWEPGSEDAVTNLLGSLWRVLGPAMSADRASIEGILPVTSQ